MEQKLRKEIGSFYEYEDVYQQWFSSSAEEMGKESFLTWITNRTENHISFFESGRSAISAIIEMAEKKVVRKVCLLPSYICDTVIIPFVRSGWEIHFFQVDLQLSPNIKEMKMLIETFQPSVILAVPYYGVDTLSEVRELLREWQERSKGFFIEDLTQSLFLMKPCKNNTDIQIISIRKWLPIFGGGCATIDSAPDKTKSSDVCFVNAKKRAQNLKRQYLDGNDVKKEVFLKLNYEAEKFLDSNPGIYGMDLESYGVLSVYDIEAMKASRIKNANILHQMINPLNGIKNVISLQPDTAPLYYPVYVENREKLQNFLQKRDIFAPVLWMIPEQVKTSMNEDVNIRIAGVNLAEEK